MPFPKAEDRQAKHRQDSQMRTLFVIVGSYLGKRSNIYIIIFVSNNQTFHRAAKNCSKSRSFWVILWTYPFPFWFRSIVPPLEVLKMEALNWSLKFSDMANLNRMRKFGDADNSWFSLLWAPSYFIDRIRPVITVNPTKLHVPSLNHPNSLIWTLIIDIVWVLRLLFVQSFIYFTDDHLKRIMSNYHKLIRPQESRPTMRSLIVGWLPSVIYTDTVSSVFSFFFLRATRTYRWACALPLFKI
jgi:hypothetical protein